jgi:Na+/proline symporter
VKQARQGLLMNLVTDLPATLMYAAIGLMLFAYYQHHTLPEQFQSDKMIPYFMNQVFPSGVIGLVLAGLLAASLSSIDAGLSAATSIFVVDFYNRIFLKREAGEGDLTPQEQQGQVRLSRIVTIVVGIIATLVAASVGHLGDLVEICNKVIGAFYGPVFGIFVLGMFCRRTSSLSAFIAGLVGTLVAVYVAYFSSISFIWPYPLSLAATIAVGFPLSYVLPPASAEAQELTWVRVLTQPLVEEETA